MGEVYRARDARLRRDVAIKVIHASLATPEYVHRLNREARSAGALNHPNILAVFDVGSEGGVPYIVSELLEGESLRHRLDRGPLPYRKALEVCAQIASALAAAHEKGVCHRDVKPANVFLTADGRAKLLDFGLAKLEKAPGPAGPDDSTASPVSRPGVARGTAGYMAPEQVRGEDVDHRADIFALGAVLYELLTGRRAFQRATPVETMSAVLKEDPPDLLDVNPALPAAAAAAVRRCLEKSREERFQSARDLAFHLRHLEEIAAGGARRGAPRRSPRFYALAAFALAAAAAAAWAARDRMGAPPRPEFQQLTFDRGRIGGARFTPSGIVYSQAVGFGDPEVRIVLAGTPESRALGLSDADVFAERAGELAVSVHRRFLGGARFVGTLAVVSAQGGTPREVLDEVEEADWDAATGDFAVTRSTGFGAPGWLEYPIGRKIYESSGSAASLHGLRLSRDGKRVAFFEDPTGIGSGGRLRVVDREGNGRVLTRDWVRARGVAWSPGGDEIWFTADDGRANRVLRAVDLDGRERVVLDSPGSLRLWDIAADGKVLLARDDERMSVFGLAPGAARERDLSAFDDAGLAALSPDGGLLLFGDRYGLYVRTTSGSPPTKLGVTDVFADDLSPDGKLVLGTSAARDRLVVIPVGPGTKKELPPHGGAYSGARWFPDGHRILFNTWEAAEGASGEARRPRTYVTDRAGTPATPLTAPGVWTLALSPDGRRLAVRGAGAGIGVMTIGEERVADVAGSQPADRPVGWTEDGRSLWVFQRGRVPADIVRLDVEGGRRTAWKTLVPPDPAGVFSINDVRITPTGHAYFYSYRRILSELYVASGLR
jgi:Tol biopolymer transport system component